MFVTLHDLKPVQRNETSLMKNLISHFRRAVPGALLLAAIACPWRTAAVDIVVYTNGDSGNGSLRQAIADNAAQGGGNTIIFSNVVTGAITLTNGELLISNNVTLLG